jgi:hypothetical protein
MKKDGLPNNHGTVDPRNIAAIKAAECGKPARFKFSAGPDTTRAIAYSCEEHIKAYQNAQGFEVTAI